MSKLIYATALLSSMLLSSTISYSQNNQIGTTDLGAVDHSDAFLQVMKMLGNWDGKLYMTDGTVVDTSTSFNLTSNGNTIVEIGRAHV